MSLKTRGSIFHYEFERNGRTFRATTGIRNDGTKAAKKAALAIEAARLAQITADIKAGADLDAKPLTLFKALADYWEEAGFRLKDKNVKRHLAKAAEYFGRDKLFVELTTNDVSKFIAWRAAQPKHGGSEPLAANTLNLMIATLRNVYSRGRDVWAVVPLKPINWAVDKDQRKKPKKRKRILRPDEYQALKSAMDPDYWAFLNFALTSGLRKNETILRKSEIDPATGIIDKTGKGDKEVCPVLSSAALRLVHQRWNDHPEYVFTYVAETTMPEREIKPGKFMPPLIKGRRYPITVAGLNSHWFKARAQAAEDCPSLIDPNGKLTLRWHDLRRTFASDLYSATGSKAFAQRALSHSDEETTNLYLTSLDVVQDDRAFRAGLEVAAEAQRQRLGMDPAPKLLPAPTAKP